VVDCLNLKGVPIMGTPFLVFALLTRALRERNVAPIAVVSIFLQLTAVRLKYGYKGDR
jgi:hypothetical protein